MIMRAVKRQSNYSDSEATDIKRFTRQNVSCSHSEQLCLFCEKPATRFQSLHEASTFELDRRIRLCALNLQDEKLLSKLSAGDLISIEAKYHLQCLRTFYNRDRSNISTDDTTGTSRTANTAFAELISYIQSLLDEDSVTPVFQLSELKRLYLNRIQELQDDVPALSLHSTRFKNKILSYFP